MLDHDSVTGTCSSCHNGITAPGKTSNHVLTTTQCDVCHSTVAWVPATFDHDSVTGSCSSCHNGTTATGKTPNHFITSQQCDICHTTVNWTVISFSHSSPNYPGDHNGNLICIACHVSNNEVINWQYSAYKPDCAGCHAGDYEEGPHKKVKDVSKYTVSELRDCSGSCHVYKDAAMTILEKTRNSKHRASDGDF
jgi:hypothetical protein